MNVRWCDRHPMFVRLYLPVVATATLAAQLWEVLHR